MARPTAPRSAVVATMQRIGHGGGERIVQVVRRVPAVGVDPVDEMAQLREEGPGPEHARGVVDAVHLSSCRRPSNDSADGSTKRLARSAASSPAHLSSRVSRCQRRNPARVARSPATVGASARGLPRDRWTCPHSPAIGADPPPDSGSTPGSRPDPGGGDLSRPGPTGGLRRSRVSGPMQGPQTPCRTWRVRPSWRRRGRPRSDGP